MNTKDLTETPVCLRSKRSEVRILSGIPVFKDLAALETAAGGDKRSLPGSKTEARKQAQRHRLDVANRILRTIGRYGRQFFSNHSDGAWLEDPKRYAEFFFAPSGRLKYRDRGRAAREIDIAYHGRWAGFTDGGTLRRVVEHLRDYIIHGRGGTVLVQEYWGYNQLDRALCNNDLLQIYEPEGLLITQPPPDPRVDPQGGETLKHGDEERTVEYCFTDKRRPYVCYCGTHAVRGTTVLLSSWRRWAKGAEVIHAAE
jgi:hypothetical protein